MRTYRENPGPLNFVDPIIFIGAMTIGTYGGVTRERIAAEAAAERVSSDHLCNTPRALNASRLALFMPDLPVSTYWSNL